MAQNRWYVERVIVAFDREIERNRANRNLSEVYNLGHTKRILVRVLEKNDLGKLV